MAQSPQFKIYKPTGEYTAATKHAEDAAALAGLYGHGARIKWGHSAVVWTEGAEEISAGESYDRAAAIMNDRIIAMHVKALRKAGRTDAEIERILGGRT